MKHNERVSYLEKLKKINNTLFLFYEAKRYDLKGKIS